MTDIQAIAIIPARGGSKGIPRKNVRLLAGRPLIAHTILDAREAGLISKVYVSTDDSEIAHVSQVYGAEVIQRPPELASDTAASESALLHALETLETTGLVPDLIVFLQCTSPLRTGADIDHAILQLRDTGADSLLSVSPSYRFLWSEVGGTPKSINYDYQNRQRRQDLKPQYVENGSIYLFKPWVLKQTGNRLGGNISLFKMSESAAWEIDSVTDLEIVELLLQREKDDY